MRTLGGHRRYPAAIGELAAPLDYRPAHAADDPDPPADDPSMESMKSRSMLLGGHRLDMGRRCACAPDRWPWRTAGRVPILSTRAWSRRMQLGPSIDDPDGGNQLPVPWTGEPPGTLDPTADHSGSTGSADEDDDVRHPEVVVQLTGQDGNAYAILGTVRQALREAGHAGDIAEFFAEATSGDYDHLLQTCMRWVTVR
jgi:hypothetical protein